MIGGFCRLVSDIKALARSKQPFAINLTLLLVLGAIALFRLESSVPPMARSAEAQVVEPRIVGGTAVPKGNYRFTAVLSWVGFEPRIGRFCGGALIAPGFVLTAAHCVSLVEPREIEVYVGANRLSQAQTPTTTYPVHRSAVSAIHVHPQWDVPRNSMNNDVAVLELATPVPVAGFGAIEPVILPGSGSEIGLTAFEMLTVAGWGSMVQRAPGYLPPTPTPVPAYPDQLQEVGVPVQPNEVCQDKDGNDISDTSIMLMFCAGPVDGGQDSCQGDSGGPIFLPSDTTPETYTQIGVVSWGYGCAWQGFPGVYTRIAAPAIRNFISTATAPTPTPSPPLPPPPPPPPAPTETPTPAPTTTPTPIPPTATPTPDVQPPTAAISSPANGAKVKSPFVVEVVAEDFAGGVTSVILQECKKGTCADIAVDTEGPWRFDVAAKKGKHVLQAVAVDGAGNRGSSDPVQVQVGKTKGKRSAGHGRLDPGEAGIVAEPSDREDRQDRK